MGITLAVCVHVAVDQPTSALVAPSGAQHTSRQRWLDHLTRLLWLSIAPAVLVSQMLLPLHRRRQHRAFRPKVDPKLLKSIQVHRLHVLLIR